MVGERIDSDDPVLQELRNRGKKVIEEKRAIELNASHEGELVQHVLKASSLRKKSYMMSVSGRKTPGETPRASEA